MLSEKHASRYELIKANVEKSIAYFKENVDRAWELSNFFFKTGISETDKAALNTLGKPMIEFNIGEAFVNRLLGEFTKQEPSIRVRLSDGLPPERYLNEQAVMTQKIVEGHLRQEMLDSSSYSVGYDIYAEILRNGYSVAKVWTEYVNEFSFEQRIRWGKCFDSFMCGFDPLARLPSKSDGEYCFEIVPYTLEEFKKTFGESGVSGMKFQKNSGSFDQNGMSTGFGSISWSYKTQHESIVLVADYYEKQYKKERIVQLSNGSVILKKHYEDFIEEWNSRGFLEQAPIIVNTRYSEIQTICRYQMCETGVLSYMETDLKHLPLVFFDGNSVVLQSGPSSGVSQITKPVLYNAKGIQRLKNFCGQTIAQDIQNMIQHKFLCPVEALPEDNALLEAWLTPQQASVLTYNAFYGKNPDQAIPAPREIQRVPMPQLVESVFNGADRTTEMVLGSYNSVLGTNADALSGTAIQQGALQSNAGAIPFLKGYMSGLNQVGRIYLDLIPKYYKTPRTLPVMDPSGKRTYVVVNSNPDQKELDYDPNELDLVIEAGVNSTIQKQQSNEQIASWMSASQLFSEFINTEGLDVILDNMDIRGIDGLKERAATFMEMKREAQKRNAEQGDPQIAVANKAIETEAQIEAMRIQSQKEKAKGELALGAARVAIEKQKADTAAAEAEAKLALEGQKMAIEAERIDAENAREAVEAAIQISDIISSDK